MVNFPASLDSLSNPGATTKRNDPGFELHTVISTLNDIVEALEAKLGTGASVPTTAGHALLATGTGTSAFSYPVLTAVDASLGSDVALNNAANFFDGPSVSITAGTWLLVGAVQVSDTAGVAGIVAKLWDGTTVEASGSVTIPVANYYAMIPLAGIVTVGSTTTMKISCRDVSSTSGLIKATTPPASQGNNASFLKAIRIT